jgi:sulfur-carrier protein
MAVRVVLASYLAAFADEERRIELPARPETVRAALESLGRIYPGVRARILTEQGHLRPHVNFFVEDESIRFLEGLSTPLPAECEISILPAVSGG